MMKIPEGYTLKVEIEHHDGLLRPKTFWSVILYNVKQPEKAFIRHVRMAPLFARIRLCLAARACLRMKRKFDKFAKNKGIL